VGEQIEILKWGKLGEGNLLSDKFWGIAKNVREGQSKRESWRWIGKVGKLRLWDTPGKHTQSEVCPLSTKRERRWPEEEEEGGILASKVGQKRSEMKMAHKTKAAQNKLPETYFLWLCLSCLLEMEAIWPSLVRTIPFATFLFQLFANCTFQLAPFGGFFFPFFSVVFFARSKMAKVQF